MTLQDDMARPWFQPLVPMEQAQHEQTPGERAQQNQAHPGVGQRDQQPAIDDRTAGPVTTRVSGELPLDDVATPVPRAPGIPPAPERVEVTQPYIPAIRDEQPSFAKRLHSEAESVKPTAPTPAAPTATPAPATVTTEPVAQPASPGEPTAPTEPVAAPRKESRQESLPNSRESPFRESESPARPPKRRSLARRIVRTIIGPDLLRKDPPKKS